MYASEQQHIFREILPNKIKVLYKQESSGDTGASCFKRKEKKLKYFEGVHRSVWGLRCVSYEIY